MVKHLFEFLFCGVEYIHYPIEQGVGLIGATLHMGKIPVELED